MARSLTQDTSRESLAESIVFGVIQLVDQAERDTLAE